METFEVYPNKGIGPFRLGMTEDKVVELQNRLFPGVFPGYYCRTDYLDGRLAGVGLLADENRQILWDGLELTHVHVEELIPRLARKAEFACDCVDPELACNYRFPTLGLELWREMAYHPKLLDNPEFQAHMRVLPENLEYEQTHGWTFQAVWVRSSASMAALPLEPCRAPYDGGPYHPTPEPRPVTPERLAAVAKNTDWSRRGGPVEERTHDRHQIHESDRDGRLFQGARGAGVPSQAGVPVASPGRILF